MTSPADEFRIYVPYADVDQMGVVYYANYFKYFEAARTKLLRESGMPVGSMEKRGVFLPVVETHCVYKSPAHFDDELVVRTRCVSLKGPRFRLEYTVTRGADLIATGYSDHACTDPGGKVLRPVPEIRKLATDNGCGTAAGRGGDDHGS